MNPGAAAAVGGDSRHYAPAPAACNWRLIFRAWRICFDLVFSCLLVMGLYPFLAEGIAAITMEGFIIIAAVVMII